ncbi:DUF4998 domain-containing protein [Anseongella ginsenosidimutans]|uniref:DUF4998 domain-containing protein n=1 Tax=Anseongella ginsenosidimutans TaxID=496056 RepID=UPI001315A560|nr:DUF4998 domain-containing protein [Anseongella ginsenosidimutans]
MVCGVCSCSKEDAYKQYIPNGEVKYPGTPDTIISYAGLNRIQLALVLPDPNITRVEVFWNNKSTKLEVPVQKTRVLEDTIKILIEELEEATFNFEVFTRDEDDNISVVTEVQGTAYGESYLSTLHNRALKNAATLYGADGTTTIEWHGPEENERGLELNYTDKNGNPAQLFVGKDESLTLIADYKPGTDFRYRTLFSPQSNMVDVFAAAYTTVSAPPVTYPDLDKSKFREYILPGDAPSAYGWLLPYMWDGRFGEGEGFHTDVTVSSPHHFTFDLGVTAELSEMRIWQRRDDPYLYSFGNPKRWEVWGSTDPAPDGSYTGWTKLMDCESVKPSGSGPVTQADRDYANAGELFKFPVITQPVRYIRFRMLENWSGNSVPSSGAGVHIMEVNFKGAY